MDNWWEYDPEGLREKLRLLTKLRKSPREIARMYSHDKRSTEKKSQTGQLKLL